MWCGVEHLQGFCSVVVCTSLLSQARPLCHGIHMETKVIQSGCSTSTSPNPSCVCSFFFTRQFMAVAAVAVQENVKLVELTSTLEKSTSPSSKTPHSPLVKYIQILMFHIYLVTKAPQGWPKVLHYTYMQLHAHCLKGAFFMRPCPLSSGRRWVSGSPTYGRMFCREPISCWKKVVFCWCMTTQLWATKPECCFDRCYMLLLFFCFEENSCDLCYFC